MAVVVVTGASAGVGRAAAVAFARRGDGVALLARRPQPVPPIFQPEVAARAIVWAAHHAPRELKVGWPTVRAVYANRFVPGLLDRHLAAKGYASQQTDEPAPTDRPDNLFEPAAGDHDAHGRFDRSARSSSHLLTARIAVGDLWSRVVGRSGTVDGGPPDEEDRDGSTDR